MQPMIEAATIRMSFPADVLPSLSFTVGLRQAIK
jgi:hypothetical protein